MVLAEDALLDFDLGVIEQIQRVLSQGLYIPRCRPHYEIAKLQSAKVQVEGWREEVTRGSGTGDLELSLPFPGPSYTGTRLLHTRWANQRAGSMMCMLS